MYDADYKGPAESQPAASAAQTTWASDTAASFEAVADEEVPQTFQQQPAPAQPTVEPPASDQTPATPSPAPAGRNSAWEGGDTAAVAPATEFAPVGFGYAAEAIGRVPEGDSGMSQQVGYEQPVEEEAKEASVYEAKAKQASDVWRPGSTTSYR
jgi:hypothetical protein